MILKNKRAMNPYAQFTFSFKKKILAFTYVYGFVGHEHVTACIWRSVFSFTSVGLRNQTQVLRLGSETSSS